jgi:hypothetical protein
MPIKAFRHGLIPESKGIVVPLGVKLFRYASHFISAFRSVLNITLPTQVTYLWGGDLQNAHCEVLTSQGFDIDIAKIFDSGLL